MLHIEIADLFSAESRWPIPDWQGIETRVQALEERERTGAWIEVTRYWLERMKTALGEGFAVLESDNFQILAFCDDETSRYLLTTAEYCLTELSRMLSRIESQRFPGKNVLICLPNGEYYYSYVAAFYADEGEYGGSSGMHISFGYPHVVINGISTQSFTQTLAHELTHAALHGLGSPQWLEEGIAEYVEKIVAGWGSSVMSSSEARAMRRYWTHNGLQEFWWGAGFHSSGSVQRHSYTLSETLCAILIADHRPGLLGFGLRRVDRLLGFVRDARAEDAGQAAAESQLGYSLGTLAAKCLGPGDWEPKRRDSNNTIPDR